MIIETLAVFVINYYTCQPDVFKLSNTQLQQVNSLLNNVQQNLLGVIDVIIGALPQKMLSNQNVKELQKAIKNKRFKKKKKEGTEMMSIS